MTKMVWKFVLEVTDSQKVEMPARAKILSVEFQRGELCLWAIVNPEEDTEARTFVVLGTGHPLPDKRLAYLATVQQPPFIWHVFEEIAE